MKKGLGATIILFSLVEMLAILLYDLTFYLPFIIPFMIIYYIIFSSIGFIALGFHLNKKYKNTVTYWKFVLIGSVISILSNILFYLGISIYLFLSYPEDTVSDYNIIAIHSTYSIIECLIIGLFLKKLTHKKIFNNNDSLDSDILDE